MKFTALLLLATGTPVMANHEPSVQEKRAGCEVTSWNANGLQGMIEFTETVVIDRKNGGKMRTETKMYSTWSNLQAHEKHSLSIVNDDHRQAC